MSKLNNMLAIVLAVTWTLFIVTMVNLVGVKEKRLIDQIAISQAQSLFQIIVDMRSWTASQGGVYVYPSETTPPNPYLDHPRRDIKTTDGTQLTLVNPSYMTRQISEIGLKRRGVQTRLTSLRPIRPANAAVDWEKTALEGFEAGESSYFELVQDDERGYLYRYMAPLKLEDSCGNCHIPSHSANGIRGGISITFPVEDLVQSRIHILRLNRLSFASIWLIGLFIIAGMALIMEKVLPGLKK
jgi:hypothetical protein